MSNPDSAQPSSRDRECPHCGGSYLKFDPAFGYYSCGECGHVWGKNEGDPAWEDYMDDVQLLEQVYHSDPEYWAKLIERRLD